MFQIPGRRADSLRIGRYTNFLDTTRRALASPRAAFRTDPRCLVQARGDGAHLVLREPGDAYLLGYPLHLAGARAGGVHLGDGGNEGAVHAPVALDHVVREEAAGAELRDAQRQRAGAGASDLSR